MAITITIEAANADELRQLMQDAAETLAGMKIEDITDTKVSTLETFPPKDITVESEPQETTQDVPTIEEIRAKAQAVKDKAAVKALLNEFGARNLTALPEDRRAEFLARLEEL